MKRFHFFYVAIFLCIRFFLLNAQDRDVFICGAVIDQFDKPVQEAQIFFCGWQLLDSVITKHDGCFSLFFPSSDIDPTIKFNIQKKGYKSYYDKTASVEDTLDLGYIIIQKIGKTRDIRISGIVIDSITSRPIEKAFVEIYPSDVTLNLPKDSCYTDLSGTFCGTLTVEETDTNPQFIYTCDKDGYLPFGRIMQADSSDSFDVGTALLHLKELITFPITGKIIDSQTLDPIENAQIILMISKYTGYYQDTVFSGPKGEFSDSVMISNEHINLGCKIYCFVFKDGYRDAMRKAEFPIDSFNFGSITMLRLTNHIKVTVAGTIRDSQLLTPIENATVTLGYTIKIGTKDSLTVLRDTLFSGTQGTISGQILLDSATYTNSEIVYIIKMGGYTSIYGTVRLDNTCLNLGEILLHPSPILIDKIPVHYLPYMQKPNNIRIYSLDGRLLYEDKVKDEVNREKIRQITSHTCLLVVFRYNNTILYSKRIINIP